LNHFGTQQWWPADTPFEIIVGAVLTQRTRWKNVEIAIHRLKTAKKLELRVLAHEERRRIEELIYSVGFYKQKADRIIRFSRYLLETYDGDVASLFNKPLRNLRKELLTLKGVGPETADSILLYAAEKLILPIDAYTLRVFTRLGCSVGKYYQIQQFLMDNLPQNREVYKEFHALIVKLGKTYCKKTPLCPLCPFGNACLYAVKGDKRTYNRSEERKISKR
jgi:endonuclease-3 related protein